MERSRRVNRRLLLRSASQATASLADGVPDGLELEVARDLPGALDVGSAVDDAFDVFRGELFELRRLAVRAADIERVDVHVRGEYRRELSPEARQQVDDAAGHVG